MVPVLDTESGSQLWVNSGDGGFRRLELFIAIRGIAFHFPRNIRVISTLEIDGAEQ
jgi:hypothetical protein